MATLPQLSGFADSRSDAWGVFTEMQQIALPITYPTDKGAEAYGYWVEMQQIPMPVIYPTDQAAFGTSAPSFYAVMRGKNTGGGAAWIYWEAEGGPDPNGNYYNGSVPFSQLTDIVWATTRYVS
jgi:hypothetical protein